MKKKFNAIYNTYYSNYNITLLDFGIFCKVSFFLTFIF